jgi:hypothetical protein
MEVDNYPTPTWKRRLLVLALAMGAAMFIVHMLTIPPTPVPKELVPPIRDKARCAAGQTQDCVGGTAVMILAPAAPARASAAAPPASTPP